jgi:phage-related minor tail protein
MSDNRKPQIEPQVKTDQAVEGFKQIGKAADEMGDRVKKAGEKAGEGIQAPGEKAPEAAKKLDRATKSIIGSIERTTAALQAGERGSASYFETLAKQRGISGDALAPYLAQLRQAEAAQKAATTSLGGMEVSAKQTAAALRNVPAQFTDIVVSLQGGQAPLTVLLQQGGQLKDMFGGVGAATQALGGYILGLVNPFTLAAAAAAALGTGYFFGAKEAQEFNRALVLTGNQAGTTVGQLSAMAERLDALGTTQGKASEVLTAFAQSGRVGAESLERFALAAINLEKVGGPAVTETVKAFAELGKDPLQASLRLNESTGFLTKSLYEQIKALEDQGRSVEAAKLAQEAYSAAIEDRTPQIVEQLGYIERAWKGIVQFGAEAIDQIKQVGRVDNTLEAAIARTEKEISAAILVGDAIAQVNGEQLLGRLRESLKLQQDVNKATESSTKQAAAKAEFDKAGEKFLSSQARLERDIAQAREMGLRAGVKEEQIQARIAEIRKAAADKNKPNNSGSRELEREAALLAELSGLSKTYAEDLKTRQSLRAKGLITEVQYIASVEALNAKQPAAIAQAKALADANKQVADAEARGLEIRAQYLAGLNKGAASVAQQVQALQDEAKAAAIAAAGQLSLAQAMQQVAIARLADQQKAAGSDSEAVAAIQREIDKRRELIGLIGGKELTDAAAAANKELDRLFDPSKAQSFGDALSGAFAQAGSSLAKLSGTLESYGRTQAAIAERQAVVNAATDPAKKQREQLKLNEASQRSQVALYANMAGAAKGFFKEGTQGYKTLEAAENAFRVYQLASDLVRGTSAAAVAIAQQGTGGDVYTAFPRMAAMAAAMAALGFAVSGGFAKGGSTGGDGAKQATGQGTVFGDAQAKSESIAKSSERLADTARLQLTTQSGMLAALRNIQNTIGGITNLVLRSGQSGGSVADQFGIREGRTYSGPTERVLAAGPFASSLFGKNTRITGNGLFAGAQDLGSIVGSGLNLQDFADVNSSRKLFGIKVSNKNSTQYSEADPVLQQQFGLVFKNFYDAIKLASAPLDAALGDVTARLDSFVVDIGKIDLAGLTGEQIAEKLSAVLGAAGDSIAAAALPGLEAFQNVGEGYFETVVRVASGVETAGAALELLGINAINFTDIAKKQGDVAAEIVRQSIAGFESLDGSISSVGSLINTLDGGAEDLLEAYRALVDVRDVLVSVGKSGDSLTASMIRGAGGLEQLQSGLAGYFENFFTKAEQTAAGKASLQAQFSRLGLGALPETREAFRALAQGIDTSTDSGQKLFAQLVGLSGAFADLVPATATLADNAAEAAERMAEAGRRALESLGQSRQQLEIELLRAQGNEAGALARDRANTLARSTAGLNATDTAAVTAALAYNNALQDQITALRAATEAQRTAEQVAKQAIEDAQRRADAILSERNGLQDQLDQLLLSNTELMAKQRAALDESNRALFDQVQAATAAKAAAEQLAQAQEAAAQAEAQRLSGIASERTGLEDRLLQLQGDTAALRARELAGIDASNRALLERIFALQDAQAAEQSAAEATRQAADAAAQALDALNGKLSDLAGTRFDLENQLLGLNGNAGEVARRTRERDLAGLTQGLSATDAARVTAAYDYNLALRQQIEATTAAQEAAQKLAEEQTRAADEAQRAADQFRDAWQSITDTLFDEVARIRGLLGLGGSDSLASAQSRFAITTAQARAGDQEAAKLLPGLSQTLLELAGANATSLLELQRIRAQVAASLEQTGTGLAGRFGLKVPSFDVGTNYVPRDMLALVHEGEAIVPKAYNNQGGSNGALVSEVRALREDNKAQALAIVRLQAEMNRTLKKWDGEGLPVERVEA